MGTGGRKPRINPRNDQAANSEIPKSFPRVRKRLRQISKHGPCAVHYWWVARKSLGGLRGTQISEFSFQKYVLVRLVVPSPLTARLPGATGAIAKPATKLLGLTCGDNTHHVALAAHVPTRGPPVTRDTGARAQVAITTLACQRPFFVSTGAPRSCTGLADIFARNRVGVD